MRISNEIPPLEEVKFRFSLADVKVGDYVIETAYDQSQYKRVERVDEQYIILNDGLLRYRIANGSGGLGLHIHAVDEDLYNDTVNFRRQAEAREQVNKLFSTALEKIGNYSQDNIDRLTEVLKDMDLF